MKNSPYRWCLACAPIVIAVPLLADCSGSTESAPDGGADASTSRSSSSGSSGSSSSSSGGSGSGASSSGTSSGSSGGAQDGGAIDSGRPPVLCTGPGVPAGCVQCITDANCPTTAPRCLNGACVGCVTNSDCGTGSTPSCYPATHTCRASCVSDGGPVCAGQTNLCDTTTGACVGCRTNADCPTAQPVCSATSKLCVQCETDANCSGTTARCDTAVNTCVACLGNPDCTSQPAPVCHQATHRCVAGCVSNAQCTDAGAMACDLANNTCVECVDDSTCSGATPLCNQANGGAMAHRCVECLPAAADAGIQGCDGGSASNTCAAVGPTAFTCR
ncbi:MAG: hypothetical protein JOZ69_03275 [Myxococcales bacterium]|nr:hypothetical protein [Myxococcales bacterium]